MINLLLKLVADVNVTRLDISDEVFGSEVAFERKTLVDLLESVNDGRLWNQLKGMKETYPKYFLIVEGDPFNTTITKRIGKKLESRLLNNAERMLIRGIENAILLGWGIPIIKTNDIEDTAKRIKELYERYVSVKKNDPPRVYVKKSLKPEEIRLNMLCCCTGIGVRTAQNILEKFSFYDLTTLEDAETLRKEVKGLGKPESELVVEVFV